jgi:twitching motility protein PilT
MQTMNQALGSLVNRRMITMDDAMARSSDQDELRKLIAEPGSGEASARRRSAG